MLIFNRDVSTGKFLLQPLRCWPESTALEPVWNRVKISKNLGATVVVPGTCGQIPVQYLKYSQSRDKFILIQSHVYLLDICNGEILQYVLMTCEYGV